MLDIFGQNPIPLFEKDIVRNVVPIFPTFAQRLDHIVGQMLPNFAQISPKCVPKESKVDQSIILGDAPVVHANVARPRQAAAVSGPSPAPRPRDAGGPARRRSGLLFGR